MASSIGKWKKQFSLYTYLFKVVFYLNFIMLTDARLNNRTLFNSVQFNSTTNYINKNNRTVKMPALLNTLINWNWQSWWLCIGNSVWVYMSCKHVYKLLTKDGGSSQGLSSTANKCGTFKHGAASCKLWIKSESPRLLD